jgi:uncharacterized membrane protein
VSAIDALRARGLLRSAGVNTTVASSARSDRADHRFDAPAALEENLAVISRWEGEALHARSRTERISDWITRTAAGGPVLLIHLLWFGFWLVINTGLMPGIRPFDPFPFVLLTTIVSLEAIFLSLFVLASQSRLAQQADKRAHLDLQIDLLAEREMTVVLTLLQDLTRHLGVQVSVTPEQIRDLSKETDVHKLTKKVATETSAESDQGSGSSRVSSFSRPEDPE